MCDVAAIGMRDAAGRFRAAPRPVSIKRMTSKMLPHIHCMEFDSNWKILRPSSDRPPSMARRLASSSAIRSEDFAGRTCRRRAACEDAGPRPHHRCACQPGYRGMVARLCHQGEIVVPIRQFSRLFRIAAVAPPLRPGRPDAGRRRPSPGRCRPAPAPRGPVPAPGHRSRRRWPAAATASARSWRGAAGPWPAGRRHRG